MNIRMLSAAAVCAAFLCSSAHAAVTVFGSGPAQICYQAAEMDASPADYMTFCNQALNGGLSEGDRAATFINRGVLKLALHDYDSAAADFNSGLAINASLGEAYIDLGAVMITHRQYELAIVNINKGLTLGTKKPHLAYYDRAVADEALGNLQGAYDDYRQSLQLQPDFTKASDELKRFKVIDKPNGGA
jgi:tetratricopeptide (TPR) repeat protein